MIATDHKTTTLNVSLPELGMPCTPGNTYQLRWKMGGEVAAAHASAASLGIELHYDQGMTLFLASDLPLNTSSWMWNVGDLPSGTARIQVVARDYDGNTVAMGQTQAFVVNGGAIDDRTNGFAGTDSIQTELIDRSLIYPYPNPYPTPYPYPTIPPPSITSVQPNQVFAGSNQNFVTVYGNNLPKFGYTVVTAEGLPLLGTGTALADANATPTQVRLQIFISPDIQTQGGALRVSTSGGTAQFPLSIIGTFQLPQIDYLDPNPLYVYPSSTRQSLQLIIGGKALPTVSSQIRLEGAPYGVSYGGIIFPNSSSDVIRINVEPFLPSGTYFFDVVANTARKTLKLIKF